MSESPRPRCTADAPLNSELVAQADRRRDLVIRRRWSEHVDGSDRIAAGRIPPRCVLAEHDDVNVRPFREEVFGPYIELLVSDTARATARHRRTARVGIRCADHDGWYRQNPEIGFQRIEHGFAAQTSRVQGSI